MAKKYIDAEKLKAEIERLKSLFSKEKEIEGASKTDKLSLGARVGMLEEVIVLIDSLQQEQPSEDLEKEITDWEGKYRPDLRDIVRATAYHFYSLVKQAKKEE